MPHLISHLSLYAVFAPFDTLFHLHMSPLEIADDFEEHTYNYRKCRNLDYFSSIVCNYNMQTLGPIYDAQVHLNSLRSSYQAYATKICLNLGEENGNRRFHQ